MEVELKFTVTDRGDGRPPFAGDGRSPGTTWTPANAAATATPSSIPPDRRFLAAGYYLRRRETGGGVRITLKQLAHGAGGVMRREELEALVAADVPLSEWPEGELRERVRAIAGDAAAGAVPLPRAGTAGAAS